MLEKLQRFVLTGRGWGNVPVLRPVPAPGNPWGTLVPLQGTVFESLIPVVTGEAWSHALNGHLTPLMRQLGPPPDALLRMIPVSARRCAEWKTCGAFWAEICNPGPKTPDCWTVPGFSADASLAATETVLAWREGRHVVIVDGEEFV